jgi:8-oxo-dGTP diphosphatase
MNQIRGKRSLLSMPNFFIEKPEVFNSTIEVSTVFMELDDTLLLLKRTRCSTWGVPGGKLEKGETPVQALIREIWEELHIVAPSNELLFQRSLYVSHPKVDYKIHLFRWVLHKKPIVILDPKEHVDYLWQAAKEFGDVELLEGQLEAFKYVYFH